MKRYSYKYDNHPWYIMYLESIILTIITISRLLWAKYKRVGKKVDNGAEFLRLIITSYTCVSLSVVQFNIYQLYDEHPSFTDYYCESLYTMMCCSWLPKFISICIELDLDTNPARSVIACCCILFMNVSIFSQILISLSIIVMSLTHIWISIIALFICWLYYYTLSGLLEWFKVEAKNEFDNRHKLMIILFILSIMTSSCMFSLGVCGVCFDKLSYKESTIYDFGTVTDYFILKYNDHYNRVMKIVAIY